jgi:hypothetical protein
MQTVTTIGLDIAKSVFRSTASTRRAMWSGAVAPNVLDRTFEAALPTANGSLTSPMCGPLRDGSMWRR